MTNWQDKTYYVYLMASRSGVLYTGVTGDLERRVYEHKHGSIAGFSKKYQTTMLVHYETTGNIESAILREKQIKGWIRIKKELLIQETNPEWKDLSEDFIDSSPAGQQDQNDKRKFENGKREN